ncbi:MAG: hypothetical protein M1816_006182 [Peltula sp. TS41687]|nr:MAG: hypothetical protein M1816_006182 [Peltula sp. TS41687]
MADNPTSELLTHLYQYFGVLLGCSMQGQPAYPAYEGDESQYQVHKFMHVDQYEMGYFITQVGLAAASFGVTKEDVAYVGEALTKLFSYRCSPPTTVVKAQGEQLQSICTDAKCPLAENAMCGLYDDKIMDPANATMVGNGGSPASSSSSSASASSRSASASSSSTGASSTVGTSTPTTGGSTAATPTGAGVMVRAGVGMTLMGMVLGVVMFFV